MARIDGTRATIGSFIGMSVIAAATCFLPFGIYLKAMTADLGFSRTHFSLGFSLAALLGALLTPLAGRWIDRAGSRAVIIAGCVLLPIAMASFGLVQGVLSYYLACTLLGIAAAVSAPSTILTLPPQWFERRLGLMLALGGVGFGLGSTVAPYLTGHLVAALGWRHAWFVMAAIVAVVGLANSLFVIRDNPEVMAARQGGRLEGRDSSSAFTDAVRTPAFWLLASSYMFAALVHSGTVVHLVAFALDHGLAVQQSATLISAVGIAAIVGRLGTGALLDRISYVPIGCVLFAMQAVGIFLLINIQHVPQAPLLAALCLGLSAGGESDLMPFVLRRRFGLPAFGRLYGLAYGIYQVGPMVGPLFMGAVYDRLGVYTQALWVFVALAVLAGVALAVSSRVNLQVAESGPA